MKDRTKNWIIAILFLIVLTGAAWFGYSRYPLLHPVSEIHDTIIIRDTIFHHIPDTVPWLVVKKDTVIIRDTVPADVDTSAILQAYYDFHVYTRTWNDSSLVVTLRDVISENRVFDSWFDYKITRPQTIINNTTVNYSYSRYIYLGGTITYPDAEWSNMAVFFAFKQGLFGAGYIPYKKGFSLTGAIKIVKLR